jgi:hypothetical protein
LSHAAGANLTEENNSRCSKASTTFKVAAKKATALATADPPLISIPSAVQHPPAFFFAPFAARSASIVFGKPQLTHGLNVKSPKARLSDGAHKLALVQIFIVSSSAPSFRKRPLDANVSNVPGSLPL